MSVVKFAFVGAVLVASASAVSAGEWRADRLRGVVLMMVDGTWQPVARGDIIDDSRVIRTGANGQVTFSSGEQVIELERNTQIQVSAAPERDHTWILQAGGQLTVDVEAKDVEHFGVRTQHVVAVVKGTRFTVSADPEAAYVGVLRGTVSVNETNAGLSVDLSAGQQASGGGGHLTVSGDGDLPVVRDANGRAVITPPAPAAGRNLPVAPGRSVRPDVPGHLERALGNNGDARENSGRAQGHGSSSPGQSGSAPDHSSGSSGISGIGSGNSGNAGDNGNPGDSVGGAGASNSGSAPASDRSSGAPGNRP